MTVDSQHPEYDLHLSEWQKVADCCNGQRAIKAKSSEYLPVMEGTTKQEKRYLNYLERAVFVNYVGRTRDGLLGAVFRKPVECDVPEVLDYLKKNADGAGESIESVAKDVTGEVIAKGRHLLLVDFPAVAEGITLEQQQALKAEASINRYTTEQVINWRVTSIGGKQVVDLIVLCEKYDSDEDEFAHDTEKQYRVLRLTDGIYSQQVYRDGVPTDEPQNPRKADGTLFKEIPAVFIGSENNDATVDIAPLADIAHVNLAHYRNSADLEENCFIHGQLTLGISSNMSTSAFTEANPNGITVGSMTGHFLGEGGGFTSVQAAENQLADKLMERKEEQMRKLGARMVEDSAAKTATQSKIDATGESSILSTIVDNVSQGFGRCIGWCGEFMGTDATEAAFQLNKKFFDDDANPQMMMAAMQLNDRGIVAKSDLQDMARSQGIVKESRTNEDIDGEVEITPPASMTGAAEVIPPNQDGQAVQ